MVGFILHVLFSMLVMLHQSGSQRVSVQNHAQFESVLTDKQMAETNDIFWSWRSEASAQKVLRLEDETGRYIVEFTICVDPITVDTNVSLQLENIRYSNDGPSDILTVTLDEQVVAIYTFERWGSGHEWNVFHNSGRLGEAVVVAGGEHKLHVTVITDQYGVELDRIDLNALNHNRDTPLFCGGRLIIR